MGEDNCVENSKAGEQDKRKKKPDAHARQGGDHEKLLEFITQFFSFPIAHWNCC